MDHSNICIIFFAEVHSKHGEEPFKVGLSEAALHRCS